MRGVLPPALAQDLALLELVRQLDAWEAGSLATLSLARIEDAVAGLKEGLLSYPNLPNHREQTDYVLGVLRGWGVDVDDPFVLMDVEDGFRYDHESEDDYRDRMREREMRDDMERDLDIVPLRHTLRRNR